MEPLNSRFASRDGPAYGHLTSHVIPGAWAIRRSSVANPAPTVVTYHDRMANAASDAGLALGEPAE